MWVVWDESVCGSLLRCLRPGVRPLKLWVQHTSHSLHLRVSHMWIPTWERQRDTVSSSSWSCSRAFFSPTKPTLPVSQGFSGAGLIQWLWRRNIRYCEIEGFLKFPSSLVQQILAEYLLWIACQALGLGLRMQRKRRPVFSPKMLTVWWRRDQPRNLRVCTIRDVQDENLGLLFQSYWEI